MMTAGQRQRRRQLRRPSLRKQIAPERQQVQIDLLLEPNDDGIAPGRSRKLERELELKQRKDQEQSRLQSGQNKVPEPEQSRQERNKVQLEQLDTELLDMEPEQQRHRLPAAEERTERERNRVEEEQVAGAMGKVVA